MRTVSLLVGLMLLSPPLSYAGQIFGSLRKPGGPAVAGSIEINCNGQIYRGNTDPFGSYSIFAQQQGKCIMTVNYENRLSKPTPVFSYGDPTRYDFEVLPSGDLKRR